MERFSIPEVGYLLALTPSRIYQMVRKGELEVTGKPMTVSASALARFLRRRADVPPLRNNSKLGRLMSSLQRSVW